MLTNRAGPCAASRLLLQNRKHACAPARCTAQVCTLLPNREPALAQHRACSCKIVLLDVAHFLTFFSMIDSFDMIYIAMQNTIYIHILFMNFYIKSIGYLILENKQKNLSLNMKSSQLFEIIMQRRKKEATKCTIKSLQFFFHF